MLTSIPKRCDVLIAGAGIAASATALRLLSFGFHPILLYRHIPCYQAAEAIPESALRLFTALELESLLPQSNAVSVQGFETTWGNKGRFKKVGRVLHVDRATLANNAMAEAIRRGATIIRTERMPKLVIASDSVRIKVDNSERHFFAAVDATGRAALWSKPVRRFGRRTAKIFRIPNTGTSHCGKVIKTIQGWAYRIDLPNFITVGVISEDEQPYRKLDEQVILDLDLPDGEAFCIGRRPAFPQWSEEPLKGHRLAVGDAAFAHDPIAGQGVRFALSSALAASAVIRTLRDYPQNRLWANSYYNEIIAAERRRHISYLEDLYNQTTGWDSQDGYYDIQETRRVVDKAQLPLTVCFTGVTSIAGVQRQGIISPDEVITLENGNHIRWLGKFDLLHLRDICPAEISVETLCEQLSSEQHLTRDEINMLIRWGLTQKILVPGKSKLG